MASREGRGQACDDGDEVKNDLARRSQPIAQLIHLAHHLAFFLALLQL